MPKFQNREYAAFLFDMDGTMLDSSSVVVRVWTQWAHRHNIDPAPLLAACHGVQGPDTIRRFGHANIDVAAEAKWLHDAEIADIEGVAAIDGIAELLKELDPASWAIVTSAPRDLASVRLAAVGLPMPATMVTAEDVEKGKPDPEGFLKAAHMLGVSVTDCLIFEDSPAGVAAARAAGAHVAVVGDLVQARDAELAISNYLQAS